jgi:hypothetical protein
LRVMNIKRPSGFQIFFLVVIVLSLLLTLISICAQNWATTKFLDEVEVDFNLWSGCKVGIEGSSDQVSCDTYLDVLDRYDTTYNIGWITACRWLMFFSLFTLLIICAIAVFTFLKDPEGVISTLLRIALVMISVLTGALQIAAVALGAVGCFAWIDIDNIHGTIKMSLKFGWFCALFAFLSVGLLNITSCVWVCCLSRRQNHGGGTVYLPQSQPQYAPSPYNQPQNVHYQPQTSNIAFQPQPQYPPQQQQPYYQQPPPPSQS